MTATITEFQDKETITVIRSDGEVFHPTYFNSKKGHCMGVRSKRHKDYIGEKVILKCGLQAEVIDAASWDDVTIRTENGFVREHIVIRDFRLGNVRIPKEYWPEGHAFKKEYKKANARIGETVDLPYGMSAEIIEYKRGDKITAKRSDGEIFHTSYQQFLKGIGLGMQKIARQKARQEWIGEKYVLKCGLTATVIDVVTSKDLSIRVDGTDFVKHHVGRGDLQKGNVRVPREYWPDTDG